MKKNAWMVLGTLLLMAGGCAFDRDAPEAYVPDPAQAVAGKSEELPTDDGEIRVLQEKIDALQRRLDAAESPEAPETQPTPPETAGPETAPVEPDPEEIVTETETPSPVPSGRGATLDVFQGAGPLHPLRPAGPTLGGSCGEGASIEGDNTAGRVTLGTGPSNYCKITFGASQPFAAAPVCTASPASTQCGGSITVGTTNEDGVFLLAGDGSVNFEEGCAVNYICVVSE